MNQRKKNRKMDEHTEIVDRPSPGKHVYKPAIEYLETGSSTEVDLVCSLYGCTPSYDFSASMHNLLSPTMNVISTSYGDYRGIPVHQQAIKVGAIMAVGALVTKISESRPPKRLASNVATTIENIFERRQRKRSSGWSKVFFR